MTIVFYDIASSIGPWSPNTWKIRYCLNMKQIPYKTEWIEYPDIEALSKKLGLQQNATRTTKKSGKLFYTLPAIHDTATGVYISDSAHIAEYIEKQYPDGPKIFPHNTIGLQIDFHDRLNTHLDALWDFVIPAVHRILNPASQEYYRRTREAAWGKTLEEIPPSGDRYKEEWGKVEAGFAQLASLYSKKSDDGQFIMGGEVSWADFVMGAHLMWFKSAWGDEDNKWKTVMALNGGTWKRLLDGLSKYSAVN